MKNKIPDDYGIPDLSEDNITDKKYLNLVRDKDNNGKIHEVLTDDKDTFFNPCFLTVLNVKEKKGNKWNK